MVTSLRCYISPQNKVIVTRNHCSLCLSHRVEKQSHTTGVPHSYIMLPAMPINKAWTARLRVQKPTFFSRRMRLC